MPRFFIEQDQIQEENNIINIVGDDAHHIARSLRMAVGDSVIVCDMQGNEYDCSIERFEDDRLVELCIRNKKPPQNEPPCRIALFQALPKADKLDTVIQKAVECGASAIIPFESERCVVKAKADAEGRKTERRARIAAEAAKQCGRSLLPAVSRTVSFADMLSLASEYDIVLFCYEGEGTLPLGRILSEKMVRNSSGSYPSVAIIIGSEGGFSPKEVQAALDKNMICTGLGKRILRTETASGFALSCIVCKTELE